MDRIFKQKGFSLTEVLMSLGILTVAMLFIAGVFPVGIHYATVSTDRTMAAVVADEAFAKLRLYDFQQAADLKYIHSGDPAFTFSRDVNDVYRIEEPYFWDAQGFWRRYEYFYPSVTYYTGGPKPKYTWAALLRRLGPDPKQIQATVFVCRYLGPNAEYYRRFPWLPPPGHLSAGVLDFNVLHLQPVPVFMDIFINTFFPPDEIYINPAVAIEDFFINDGSTIVDDETGQIYRVLERYPDDPGTAATREDRIIRLDRDFEPGEAFIQNNNSGKVWVIPPRVNTLSIDDPPEPVGKSPCVAVYQRIIRF